MLLLRLHANPHHATEVEAAERERGSGDDEGGLTVLVTADKDIRFQHVIWMMDLLKNEGVSAIMFNSELFTSAKDAARLPR